MRIVIIDGSARKGNTLTAINTFIKGASEGNQIEVIHPEKLHIAPCKVLVRAVELASVTKAVWTRMIQMKQLTRLRQQI